jgi:hypothetical protein
MVPPQPHATIVSVMAARSTGLMWRGMRPPIHTSYGRFTTKVLPPRILPSSTEIAPKRTFE